MALFGKKKSADSDVPADLQQYYSSGNGGTGRLIMRIGAFVAILALLVLGSVWLFNSITGDDEAAQQPTTAQNGQGNNQGAQNKQSEEDKKDAEQKAKADADAKRQQEEANRRIAEEQAQAGGTGSATPAPAPAPQTQTPAGGQGAGATAGTQQLPNAGPGETAAVLFAGAAAFAAIAHALLIRRRATR